MNKPSQLQKQTSISKQKFDSFIAVDSQRCDYGLNLNIYCNDANLQLMPAECQDFSHTARWRYSLFGECSEVKKKNKTKLENLFL